MQEQEEGVLNQETDLEQVIRQIRPLDEHAMEQAKKQWNSIAKPLHSLGKLEEHIIRIAGITGNPDVKIEEKALIVMCADNGVVEEGVTQTGQEVTAIVAENFLSGETSAAIMCKKAGARILPIDIGMAGKTKVPDHKVACGTRNFAKEPAMTREQALQSILTGVRIVEEQKKAGVELLATGEMGIGNTTTSSAVLAALLQIDPEKVTGRGAGLTSAGLSRKIQVIRQALALHKPDANDPVDVLAKVGGFDIGGLAGVYLGAAKMRLPVLIDGFISGTAALLACRLCPEAKEYMIASHKSKEPGMQILLEALGLSASLDCDMCLGEGTGAVAFFPVLDMAAAVYRQMSTFADIQVEEYQELGDK
ncbi:MAG: nicotinate-nucleotide--dimethylbenzimidazole phosphoribosyltransferase [Merdimonas faecis]|uniref:Nicotinate-nucleotide--dimethylbenzimidazole phosphoribosyltransferase n=1 Tax=Merdimonas faecis TaxID=1653435 RepID=A0A9D2VYP9_9FIRM|nr:nicotinate-nucleotide--dimethylbenzimidazole phosphoribosyltransferase [Merdimonas faecis]HJH50168.1 nicotinate-nucleotide--dimethylbenzimidazole phosphoribosyltransferase [Merdimonas faecis]